MSQFMRLAAPVVILACAIAGATQQQQHRTAQKPVAATPAAPRSNSHIEAARENSLGVALMNRQQFETALGKFQRACVLDPRSDVPCLNMGIAFANMQRYDDARRVLAKSAELDPANPRAWFNLGLIDKAEGKADAAIIAFQKVAQIDPNDPDTQYFLGLLYSQEQQYAKAIACFRAALKLNPFHLSAEFGLAQALFAPATKMTQRSISTVSST